MTSESALLDLQSKNYFIWDHFLSPEEMKNLVLDYHQIYARGLFKLAGIGNAVGDRNLNPEIRSDETYWLDPTDLTQPQTLLWNRLEGLKKEINEHCFLGLWSLDGHYSRYPITGHYRNHLDRFNDNDQRTISMVLYLNSDWVEGDGGELRFHFADCIPNTEDITPLGGRLVCFLSSSVHHEVLTSNKVRLSFAGWWKRRA